MAEGLKITLSALPRGLTVDKYGKKLLEQPFVFQCPPMEQFMITRAFSFGNYDTIDDGQFTRRSSRQLKTWQFDTLAMDLGSDAAGRPLPRWVPFPQANAPGSFVGPDWYLEQIERVHDAGCPFRFTAHLPAYFAPLVKNAHGKKVRPLEAGTSVGITATTSAVLLGFNETHTMGEDDTIYFQGVSFSEWRDGTESQRGLGQGRRGPKNAPPTTVIMSRAGVVSTLQGFMIPLPRVIVSDHLPHASLAQLSTFFYGTPEYWRDIARANKLTGGGPSDPLITFPKYHTVPKAGVKIKIPAPPPPQVTKKVPQTPSSSRTAV